MLFRSPMAEFSRFAGILSAALSQHHLLGFEIAQLDFLEKEMATHSSILAGRAPWTDEPGGLQPMGSQRLTHD